MSRSQGCDVGRQIGAPLYPAKLTISSYTLLVALPQLRVDPFEGIMWAAWS
jgi:hypothetical protein